MVAVVGDMNGSLLSEENRAKFTENENTVIALFEEGLMGKNEAYFEERVAENYTQHAVGVAQGREGIRGMARARYWDGNTRTEFYPIHMISEGDTVVLHRVIRRYGDYTEVDVHAGVDIFRLDDQHRLAEHWHVLEDQAPDYDPNALT